MFASIALGLVLLAEPRPIDLTTLDRTIRVEPAYPATPAYCLFVFGPQARHKVWVVRAGNDLFIDRNGNGDLTDPGERLSFGGTSVSFGDIVEPDTKRVHRNFRLNFRPGGFRAWVNASRLGQQMVATQEHEKPNFAPRPEEAPIIHFDGSLTMSRYSTLEKLPRGATRQTEDNSLRVMLGSAGLGKGTFAAVIYDCVEKRGPLMVEIDYPSGPAPSQRFRVTQTLQSLD